MFSSECHESRLKKKQGIQFCFYGAARGKLGSPGFQSVIQGGTSSGDGACFMPCATGGIETEDVMNAPEHYEKSVCPMITEHMKAKIAG